MSSSDRSDGTSSNGRPVPNAERAENDAAVPVERSSRGRIVVRSSSHPPAEAANPTGDTSGAHVLPDGQIERRPKRDTPAERPSRRRQAVVTKEGDAAERQRRDTVPASPTSLKRKSAEQLDTNAEIDDDTFESGAASRRMRVLVIGGIATAVATTVLLWRWLF
jgi:hypothetical protein